MRGKGLFIIDIEKEKRRSTAKPIENYDRKMITEHKVIDERGKKIIKKIDAETFKLKFG